MSWLQHALYPFQTGRIRPGVVQPGWIALAGLFYATVTGGGFLFVVGLKAYALAMAAVPFLVALAITACILTGYCWDVLSRILNTRPHQPNGIPGWSPWVRYGLEGAQLLLFYALAWGIVATALVALDPLRELAPWLLLALHPVLAAPVLFSTRDRSFMGLLDACLDTPKLFNKRYGQLWLSITSYTLVFGLVVYPLVAAALFLSIVGWFCLPGLLLAYFTGMYRMLADYATPPKPDEDALEPTVYTIAEGVPENPFAVAPPLPHKPVAEYEALIKSVSENPNPWRN